VPLPYLRDPNNYSYDVELNVTLKTPTMSEAALISKSNFKYMYWSAN
jgi:fumarylacetoacetase